MVFEIGCCSLLTKATSCKLCATVLFFPAREHKVPPAMSAPSTTAVTPSAAAQSNTLDSMTLRNRHTDKTLSNYQALLAFVGKDPLAEAFLSWLENNGCSTKEVRAGKQQAAVILAAAFHSNT